MRPTNRWEVSCMHELKSKRESKNVSMFEKRQNDYFRWKPASSSTGRISDHSAHDVGTLHSSDDDSELTDRYAVSDKENNSKFQNNHVTIDDFEPSWDFNIVVTETLDDEKYLHYDYDGREKRAFSRTSTTKIRKRRKSGQQGDYFTCSDYTSLLSDTEEGKRASDNYHSQSRLRTLKHRMSQLVTPRDEISSIENESNSFLLFIIFLTYRLMSRRQLHLLGCDHDRSLILYYRDGRISTLIYIIATWMRDIQSIQAQKEINQIPHHSCDDSNALFLVQSSSASHSDSCGYSIDSNFPEDEAYLDLSENIAPKYLQNFLKILDEATDLTPDYINAHKRYGLQGIEIDDDGMRGELENLRHIEKEIETEMAKIDSQHVAEFAVKKRDENFSDNLVWANGATTTDAFYNAVTAIISINSNLDEDDLSSTEDTETTFNVENAKEIALKLINQIQSQLPQRSHFEKSRELPKVQQKIMNDLLTLSHKQEFRTTSSYEISLNLSPSVSSIGFDFEIESTINENIHGTSTNEIDIDLFSASDIAVDINRDGFHEGFCRTHEEANQDFVTTDIDSNIHERTSKSIWTTLLDRRQKSTQKSDRRSPFPPKKMVSNSVSSYLQFRKAKTQEAMTQDCIEVNSSTGAESHRRAGLKYLSKEMIRENNDSIEVVLKENTENSKSSSNDDFFASSACRSSKVKLTKIKMPCVTTAETGSHCMHNEPSWSLSPLIDDLTFGTIPTFSKWMCPNVKIEENMDSKTRAINYWPKDNTMSIFSTANARNYDNIETDKSSIQTKGVNKENESIDPSQHLSDYWNALMTHSFSPTFEENIENEPTYYMVHSSVSNLDFDPILNDRVDYEPVVKHDPSGLCLDDDYDDSYATENFDSASGREKTSTSSISTTGSTGGQSAKYKEYDPFEAASKIREVYSESNFSCENWEQQRYNKYHSYAQSSLPEGPEASISSKRIYFDIEDNELYSRANPSMNVIRLSDSLTTTYYSLPSLMDAHS